MVEKLNNKENKPIKYTNEQLIGDFYWMVLKSYLLKE
jgi:hypothetical protein